MADYILVAGLPSDSLVGAANVADSFFVDVAGALAGTDTLRGGLGLATIDRLVITAAMTIAAADFNQTRGFEQIDITSPGGGVSITLNEAMVASANSTVFTVNGSIGGDTVLGGLVLTKALALSGGGGDDLLEGGGGDDLIDGGDGADTLRGGAGNDTLLAVPALLGATDLLDGGAGTADMLRLTSGGTLGPTVFARVSGVERIELQAGASGALVLTLAAAMATTDGVALSVQARDGADSIAAGSYAGALVVLADAGADSVTGGAAADSIDGGLGNDLLTGAGGADTIDGGDGNDKLRGGLGNDLLRGGTGDDTITGGAGNDTIEAGTGLERIDGGAGNDLVIVAGDQATSGDFFIDESGTADTLQFTGSTPVGFGLTFSSRFVGFERILFGDGNDIFVPVNTYGDALETDVATVEGGAGNDSLNASGISRLTTPLRFLLRGGDGNDSLIGGLGDDTLDAGTGAGLLAGGVGADVLIVQTADMAGAPTIDGGENAFDSDDTLRLVGGGTLGVTEFANVTGIEVLELSAEGNDVTLSQALVASTIGSPDMRVVGGVGDDRVDLGLLLAGTTVQVEAGDGDDTVLGGAGNETVLAGSGMDSIVLGTGTDRVEFAAGQLTAFDTVVADQGVSGDVLEVGIAAGRTLGAGAFSGVQGFDVFLFDGGAGAAVRLPSTLVTQSGLASVSVGVSGSNGLVVDGRSVGGTWFLTGGTGDDVLFGGSGVNTISGSSGEDTIIGGGGGDSISLGSSDGTRDLALIRSSADGTVDINGTLSASQLAAADRVTGLTAADNFIAVDWQALGLPNGTTLVLGSGQNVELGWGANRLNTTAEIAGNAFGSLSAVRAAVGNITNNQPGVQERIILVIGGADETEFGVYYFEDRDDNATIDAADILRLLAIGDTDVPAGLNPGRGFTLTTFDII